MKYKEPASMEFIHSIRLKQYKETKGYSVAKKIAYIRQKAMGLLDKYSLPGTGPESLSKNSD